MKTFLNDRASLFLKFIMMAVLLNVIFPVILLGQEEKKLELSLQKVIEITLENNLDIAVERINPKIEDENILSENSFFDRTFFSDISVDKSNDPSASAFASPDVTKEENINFSAGLKQELKTGASYELKFSSVRNITNSTFSGLDPQYSSFIDLDFTQPLLKDFGIGLNTRKIKVATNDRKISQNEFKSFVMQSISDVQNIYWDLVFKRDDLKVKKQSLGLAKDLENRVRIQVDVGVLAPLEILQAQSEVAAREEAVIITENEIKDLEDQLKTKLNFPPDAEEWNLTLVPADSPSFAAEIFQLEEYLTIALESRPKMEQLKLDLDNKQIDVAYKENQMYPTIDLVASLGLNGISGNAVPVTSQSSGTTQTTRFGGDYDRSLSRALSGDTYSYDIGLKFEYPIGNRAAKSSLTASKLEVEKTLIEIKNQEQQITLEVKEAVREIQTNIKRVNVTRVSKKLAEEKMSAEEKKFEVGLSTSFKVLEFQKDLAEEQSKEIKAIIDYTKSIVNLYKVAGVTLEKNNIELD